MSKTEIIVLSLLIVAIVAIAISALCYVKINKDTSHHLVKILNTYQTKQSMYFLMKDIIFHLTI